MKHSIFRAIGALAIISAVLFATGCSDDKEQASIVIDRPALYISEPGGSASVGIRTSDAVRIEVYGKPAGWSVAVDALHGKLTVTAPEADAEDAEMSGTITLYAYPQKGSFGRAELFVSCTNTVDLASVQSNCYLVGKGGCSYSFPAGYKGEGREPAATVAAGIVWQSAKDVVRYVQTEGDRITFFVDADDEGKPKTEGNALLAGYDAEGEIVWTWHIWVSDYEPEAVGGFMDRNLGALDNKTTTTEEILASYGLYYQWGRKTPFIGPSTYNCASAIDGAMYDVTSYRVYIDYVESSDATGTVEYATANPLTYLLGTEETAYDWLYGRHDATLWSETKTVEDPCPKGWRVPSKSAFADLSIADSHTEADTDRLRMQYGWNLTDGSITSFFLGAGRRSALYGRISNVNTNDVPQPWIGCYWTSGAPNDESIALYFTLDTDDASKSRFNPSASYPRANGMQIRCVKE